LAREAAPDSINILPALLGESPQGRDHLVEHANVLALRKGNWKYIAAGGAGGKKGKQAKGDKQRAPAEPELYDLTADLAETKNLISSQPVAAQEMAEQLQTIRESGRSRE
jgi:hypothetical protein